MDHIKHFIILLITQKVLICYWSYKTFRYIMDHIKHFIILLITQKVLICYWSH